MIAKLTGTRGRPATLVEHLAAFLERLAAGEVEVYNEFSFQHELGIHLRCRVSPTFKVQFERPVGFFNVRPLDYPKKEIDIAIFAPDLSRKLAIELKFPQAGQYPEQMFEACRDIAFLERLVAGGFEQGLFAMLVADPLFWQGEMQTGIYRHFRAGEPIAGIIRKPTGDKDREMSIDGTYSVTWAQIGTKVKAASVAVGSQGKV